MGLLRVRELDFQPHLPTFWVHKWYVKSRHGLQWAASNYFLPAQLKTSPVEAKRLVVKCHLNPSGFFWLFSLQIEITASNQKSTLQIFDIWCKNIGFSPGLKFRLVSGGSREVSYSVHFHHFFFNFNLKDWTSSKFSSLES